MKFISISQETTSFTSKVFRTISARIWNDIVNIVITVQYVSMLNLKLCQNHTF